MEEWSTYAVANFIPFTTEVYLRLIERVNAAWWPLHPATLAAGIAALALALRGHCRFVGPLLALLWAWTAYGFLQHFYANLNWAGIWFARAFYLQAVLLAFLMPFCCRANGGPSGRAWPGLLLAGLGLVWPLVSMIGRNSFRQLEVAGIHPEPTAIFTLGMLLLALKGRWLWVFLPIPLLWCLVSGLSLWVLNLFQALFLIAAPMIALTGVLRKVEADR